MKKFYAFVSIWALSLLVMTSSIARSEINYQIYFDSKTIETYKMKAKIQEIYEELVGGIHKESYLSMLINNKEMFAYKKDMKVTWEDNMLTIREGDGKGELLKGSLSSQSVCVPEVQPRSLLAEIFE